MNCAFQKYILRLANVRKYIDNYTALLQVDMSLPIRGMFVVRCGLRFSFRDREVPEPRVRKGPFSLTEIWNCHNKYGFATKYTNLLRQIHGGYIKLCCRDK